MSDTAVQVRLPGDEFQPTPAELAIAPLAEEYVNVRDTRMSYTADESKLKKRLMKTMHEHNLTRFRLDDGKVVKIEFNEKLSVRKEDEDGGSHPGSGQMSINDGEDEDDTDDDGDE